MQPTPFQAIQADKGRVTTTCCCLVSDLQPHSNLRYRKNNARKVFPTNFAMREMHSHNPSMNIGAAIRLVRLEKGLTLEAVALDAGTYAGNLSKIERARQMPSLELLEKLSHALGIKMSQLCAVAESGAHPPAQALSQADNEMILLRRNYQALSATNRKLALEFLKLLGQSQNEA